MDVKAPPEFILSRARWQTMKYDMNWSAYNDPPRLPKLCCLYHSRFMDLATEAESAYRAMPKTSPCIRPHRLCEALLGLIGLQVLVGF
ncbi:hypothetical protein AK812_SmicGene19125 [Symbiodinium microadriaticum]|uniref:Uncharacterized protein n=1 Tax=Symbiodinium microadriaticum TaxID=2951 RepID=A0A1Q9DTB6_SYMMI|nr:hypothetical protein AK812_SmicGene19125 [Symbiodinium microadriaticum]